MKRTLRLRKETFTELTADQMSGVGAGTVRTLVPMMSGDVCVGASDLCLTDTCFTDGVNCTQYCYPVDLTNRPGVCS